MFLKTHNRYIIKNAVISIQKLTIISGELTPEFKGAQIRTDYTL